MSLNGQAAYPLLLPHSRPLNAPIQSPLPGRPGDPSTPVLSDECVLSSNIAPTPANDSTPRRAKVAATSSIKLSAKSNTPSGSSSTKSSSSNTKKPARDSSRRATHSQIERRRREKINDRLVTLRSLVPACAAEIEERKRQRRQEEEEARQIAAGEKVASHVRGGKRKRNRRKVTKASQEGGKDDELGLHKLEVLTHTIEYIYELQDYIRELKGEDSQVTPKRRVPKDIETDHEEDDDDDEDGSEADLEMSEWKPSVKRKIIDFNSHRSNASSGVSSLNTSPAIMSLSAESPMFSTATTAMSSTNSAFTNLTSPMMSLSSESPILRWNNEASSSPSSIQGKDAHRPSHKVIGASWHLPAPALPFDNNAKAANKGEGSVMKDESAQDAQLLLNIGSSPEVLRPMSALRQTSHPSIPPLQRRMSTITSSDNGVHKLNKLTRIGGSAPGGAHPITPTALVSPPILDLNAHLPSPSKADR